MPVPGGLEGPEPLPVVPLPPLGLSEVSANNIKKRLPDRRFEIMLTSFDFFQCTFLAFRTVTRIRRPGGRFTSFRFCIHCGTRVQKLFPAFSFLYFAS